MWARAGITPERSCTSSPEPSRFCCWACLWLRQTPLGWFILAAGVVSTAALVTAGVTGLDVPEPGTLERLMGYPITIGLAAAGLVIAQRVRHERVVRKALRAARAEGSPA